MHCFIFSEVAQGAESTPDRTSHQFCGGQRGNCDGQRLLSFSDLGCGRRTDKNVEKTCPPPVDVSAPGGVGSKRDGEGVKPWDGSVLPPKR